MKLGIEVQTVFTMPPDEMVHLAADLGCGSVGIVMASFGWNPDGYEPWSLRDDADLRKRFTAALEERGVSISLADGFQILPGTQARDLAADLDAVIEMGCTRINTAALDPDVTRCLDEFGVLVEMAAERGVMTTIEFAPGLHIKDLRGALDAIEHVGRPGDFKLLVDTMHLVRSGSSLEELAAVDPSQIDYAHLSDNTLAQRGEVYREDSQDRLPPGEGELPLREIVELIPEGVVISIEVPMRSAAEAGEPTPNRVRRAVEASRALVESVRGPGACD